MVRTIQRRDGPETPDARRQDRSVLPCTVSVTPDPAERLANLHSTRIRQFHTFSELLSRKGMRLVGAVRERAVWELTAGTEHSHNHRSQNCWHTLIANHNSRPRTHMSDEATCPGNGCQHRQQKAERQPPGLQNVSLYNTWPQHHLLYPDRVLQSSVYSVRTSYLKCHQKDKRAMQTVIHSSSKVPPQLCIHIHGCFACRMGMSWAIVMLSLCSICMAWH